MFNKFGLVEEARAQQATSNPQAQLPQLFPSLMSLIQPQSDTNQENNRIQHAPGRTSLIDEEKPFYCGRNLPKPQSLRVLFSSISQVTLEEKLEQCFQNIMSSRNGIFELQEECLWVPESQTLQEYILQEMPFLTGDERRHYLWLLSENKVISRYLQYIYDTQRLMLMNDLIVAAFYILQAFQPHRHLNLSSDRIHTLSQCIFPNAFSHSQLQHLRLQLVPGSNNQLAIVAPPCLFEATQLFTQGIITAANSSTLKRSSYVRQKKLCKRLKRIRRVSCTNKVVIRYILNGRE